MNNIILTIAVIFFTVPILFIVVAGCIIIWNMIVNAIMNVIHGIRNSMREFYRQQYFNVAHSGERLYWDAKTNTLYGPVPKGE